MNFKNRYNYIAIEGNIGAGKTTLAETLASILGGQLLLERFEENPFLKDFYKDKEGFALDTESFFLNDRIKQLNGFFSNNIGLTIADFTIYKSFVFSEINLPKDVFNIFQKQFEDSIQQLTKPDLIIYLVNNTDEVKKRINQRGRSYELDIEESYLANIEQGYLSFWKQQKDLNVLLIDTSKFNFPYSIEEISSLLNYLKDTEIKGLTAF